MNGLTWIRCYIDAAENRVWVALRGSPTGFAVVISLLKAGASQPVTRLMPSPALTTVAEATQKFEETCRFYNSGYLHDLPYQQMLEELLAK